LRHVAFYKKIERDDLAAHSVFGRRLKLKTREPIATISEIRAAGIPITLNANRYGIPQGTPISSALSNLYMIDIDKEMSEMCVLLGALYQRYSDDILLACRPEHEQKIVETLYAAVSNHKLRVKEEKTERVAFDLQAPKAFQYLGFDILPTGATIRAGSLARQWRTAKRNIAKAKSVGEAAIAQGQATRIFTKKLRMKLSPVGVRNFSSYARRSSKAFGSKKIVRQVLRLERMVDQAIRSLNDGA